MFSKATKLTFMLYHTEVKEDITYLQNTHQGIDVEAQNNCC